MSHQDSKNIVLVPLFNFLFCENIIEVTQYIGIDASNSQLVYLNNADSMAEDEFSLRLSLLNRHPVMNISRLLQDGHLYVFKRWVVDLISVVSQKRTMASLKEHVLPLLVKSQYQKVLADREGVTKGIVTMDSFLCTLNQWIGKIAKKRGKGMLNKSLSGTPLSSC